MGWDGVGYGHCIEGTVFGGLASFGEGRDRRARPHNWRAVGQAILSHARHGNLED